MDFGVEIALLEGNVDLEAPASEIVVRKLARENRRVSLEDSRCLGRDLLVVLVRVAERVRDNELVLVAQHLERGVDAASLGLEGAAAGREENIGVIRDLGARPRGEPADIRSKFGEGLARGLQADHSAMIAEDEHADPHARATSAREEPAREQLDVVAVRADEQGGGRELHKGPRDK